MGVMQMAEQIKLVHPDNLVKIIGSLSSQLIFKTRYDKISSVESTEDKMLEINDLIKELDKKLIVKQKSQME